MPDDLENLPLALVSKGPFGVKIRHWQVYEIPKWIFLQALEHIYRRPTTDAVIPLSCANPENVKIAVKKR